MESIGVATRRHRFERTVLSQLDAIYSAALYLVDSDRDAERLAQRTMIEAHRQFDVLPDDTDWRRWTFQVLASMADSASFIRAVQRQPRRADEVTFVYQPIDTLQDIDATGELFFSEITEKEIREAIRTLPDDLRLPVVLFFVGGFSYADIASIVGVPVTVARARLHRGRQQLRAKVLELSPV